MKKINLTELDQTTLTRFTEELLLKIEKKNEQLKTSRVRLQWTKNKLQSLLTKLNYQTKRILELHEKMSTQ